LNSNPLTTDEKKILLDLARRSITKIVAEKKIIHVQIRDFSRALQQNGASFVTLTEEGELRGCIGTLEAYQPLVQDVCEHAAAAATEDFRFLPVQEKEIPLVKIEISRLTPARNLQYDTPEELLRLLCPNVDGVILKYGERRATFLPQVWEKLPKPEDFLTHLCEKMRAPGNYWRQKKLQVMIYQVEEFDEGEF
jgi:AmmeMemoRadiSam system protein A